MKRSILIASLALVMTLGWAAAVSAHAVIDHCTPAPGSTVATAPGQVVCVMSEEIDTKQSTVSVWDANNTQVDKKDAHVDLNDPDHKTLLVSLDTAAMKNGIYTVKWHSVTPDDNGISDGTWQFIVGSAAVTPMPTTIVVAGETTPAAGATGASTTTAPTVVATSAATLAATAASVPSATAAATAAATATAAGAAVAATSQAPSAATETVPQASATPVSPATLPTTGAGPNLLWPALAVFAFVLLVAARQVYIRR